MQNQQHKMTVDIRTLSDLIDGRKRAIVVYLDGPGSEIWKFGDHIVFETPETQKRRGALFLVTHIEEIPQRYVLSVRLERWASDPEDFKNLGLCVK